jgi:importin subunit beta-1
VVIPEIHKTFEIPAAASAEARDKQAEVQGQLCGVLQVIIQKLSEENDTKAAVLQYADSVRSAHQLALRISLGRVETSVLSSMIHGELACLFNPFTHVFLLCTSKIMETLLRIFQFRSANVHEEAMLAVGSFTYAVGRHFVKYLPQFSQYLKTGLTNYQEWQVIEDHADAFEIRS